jgi:hypothetical protein
MPAGLPEAPSVLPRRAASLPVARPGRANVAFAQQERINLLRSDMAVFFDLRQTELD